MDPMPGWLIFACRTTYAAEVAEILWRRGDAIAAVIDNLPDASPESPLGPVLTPATLDPAVLDLPVVVPLLTPGYRYTVEQEARSFGLHHFPALVDPTAIVATTSAIGAGSVVNAASVVGATTTIGEFVHVNRSASIGHDNWIESYTTIGPGCVLAGGVHVRRGAFLGAGVVCAPETTIGANAVVGAGSVVVRDIPPGAVALGNPAAVMREGNPGYQNVSVPVAP